MSALRLLLEAGYALEATDTSPEDSGRTLTKYMLGEEVLGKQGRGRMDFSPCVVTKVGKVGYTLREKSIGNTKFLVYFGDVEMYIKKLPVSVDGVLKRSVAILPEVSTKTERTPQVPCVVPPSTAAINQHDVESSASFQLDLNSSDSGSDAGPLSKRLCCARA